MEQSYHVIANLGGVEPPKLAAIPPDKRADHPCLKAAEIASIEVGDSRDSVETEISSTVNSS
jgi:hypothetical protein